MAIYGSVDNCTYNVLFRNITRKLYPEIKICFHSFESFVNINQTFFVWWKSDLDSKSYKRLKFITQIRNLPLYDRSIL